MEIRGKGENEPSASGREGKRRIRRIEKKKLPILSGKGRGGSGILPGRKQNKERKRKVTCSKEGGREGVIPNELLVKS